MDKELSHEDVVDLLKQNKLSNKTRKKLGLPLQVDSKTNIKLPTSKLDMSNPYKAKPKKEVKPKKLNERIFVCGTEDSFPYRSIVKYLKTIGVKNIDYIVTGIVPGVAADMKIVCRELGIQLFASFPVYVDKKASTFISNGKNFKIFKPTQVVAFTSDLEDNSTIKEYHKLCLKHDTPFHQVKK